MDGVRPTAWSASVTITIKYSGRIFNHDAVACYNSNYQSSNHNKRSFMNIKKITYAGGSIIVGSILCYGFWIKTSQNSDMEARRIVSKRERAIAILCKDDYIASEIAKSKYDFLAAAIAKVESDCRPQIIGDNGDSYGLFQVQSKHWNLPENDTVPAQIKHFENIIDSLVSGNSKISYITRYNGKGKKARLYRKKVLANINTLEELANGKTQKKN